MHVSAPCVLTHLLVVNSRELDSGLTGCANATVGRRTGPRRCLVANALVRL